MAKDNNTLSLLINLDESRDRLAAATENLGRQGIPFQRVPAVHGQRLSPQDLAGYDAGRTLRFYGRALSKSEIGCYKSHLECLRLFLRSDKQYCLVLEDDIELQPGTAQLLTDLPDYLDANVPNWDVVNLSRSARKLHSSMGHIAEGYEVERAFYFPLLASALLWSRPGARFFLQNCSTIYGPVDEVIRHVVIRRGTGLTVSPAPIRQSGLSSDIDKYSGGSRHRDMKKNAVYYLARYRRSANFHLHTFRNLMLKPRL